MNSRKIAFALLLLTMVTMVVVPCALARQTLQILVHEGGDYLERTMRFWEAFERANPDIAVEIVPGPGGGSSPEEKLAVMVAGGIPPDLVRLWGVKLVAAAGWPRCETTFGGFCLLISPTKVVCTPCR